MKYFRLMILLILSFATMLFSQYSDPQSPLFFSTKEIKTSSISQKIRSTRTFFKTIDIDELKVKIHKNNNEVDNAISLAKSKMSNFFMDKQEVLKLKDIKKIKERITEMEKNRAKIKQEIQQDLANINYQGLFVVALKNIDILDSKQILAKKAEKLLAPKAIEDLNGAFVSSLTVIKDNRLLADNIKSVIAGEMSIEKQYISKTINGRSNFLYLVKVNVAPLKKSIKTGSGQIASLQGSLAMNLLSDYNYKSALQNFGVPADEIQNIEFEVKSSQEPINLANSTSSRRLQQILQRGENNLQKLDKDIDELKNSLYNRSDVLRQTIEQRTTLTFKENDIVASIDAALKYFDDKIKQLKNELMAAKEKELVGRYDVNVTVEGKPEQDIAKTAVDVYKQIKQSYSKVEQFMEETEVENYRETNYQRGTSVDIFRDVENIWLYPVAGDNDNFLLTVVAKFKISSMRKSGGSSPAITTTKQSGDMIFVKGGTFQMGSNDGSDNEKPIHKVYVDDFYISKYEVTNKQFCTFLNEKGNQKEGGETWLDIKNEDCRIVKQGGSYVAVSGFDKHPVIVVSWFGAKAYCQWAGGRLPTEAEWEYAARGGRKSRGYKYSGSDNIGEVGWYFYNSRNSKNDMYQGRGTHPVGSKKVNELGIYDMSGNVWEWCADWYDYKYYSKSPYENPKGASSGSSCVIRGGSWKYGGSGPPVAERTFENPTDMSIGVGFRLVR